MLGRLVKDEILAQGVDYPMGEIASVLRDSDLTLLNLECAVTDHQNEWHGDPKAFYFGAPSVAIQSLLNAGVNLVNLANNHLLDFDTQGLYDTLEALDKAGIAHAGAGKNLAEALTPAQLESKGLRFSMVSYCDHQRDFAANEQTPGIAFLDLTDEDKAIERICNDMKVMKDNGVDWPILSLHWGPNMVHRPDPRFKRIAHAAIDAGAGILFGHSAHVFHGIEIYKGKPIIYAAGDLVDDYYVDSEFKNDHQLLFELELECDSLKQINMIPIFISACHTELATGKAYDCIAERITDLCAEMGTSVVRNKKQFIIKHVD